MGSNIDGCILQDHNPDSVTLPERVKIIMKVCILKFFVEYIM